MKKKKLVKRVTFAITFCCLMGLLLSTYHIHKLTRSVERDIASSNAELEDNMTKLQNLQEEMEEMDSVEYIERIAREQLGMVDADTIIIKEKP